MSMVERGRWWLVVVVKRGQKAAKREKKNASRKQNEPNGRVMAVKEPT